MTSLRGVGGGGRGVNVGSGDDGLDLANMLEMLGTERLEWTSEDVVGGEGGDPAKDMIEADSASSVSPIL